MNPKEKFTRTKEPAPGLPWRRILVPVDFSKLSLRAFEVAVPLARDSGARLFLLAAIESAVYPGGLDPVLTMTPDSELVANAKAELPKLVRRFVPPSVCVTLLVELGGAAGVITRVAEEQAIDLIVLASHGRTGLSRVLLGSTAEQVVRYAHCPVYVVRRATKPGRVKEKT